MRANFKKLIRESITEGLKEMKARNQLMKSKSEVTTKRMSHRAVKQNKIETLTETNGEVE